MKETENPLRGQPIYMYKTNWDLDTKKQKNAGTKTFKQIRGKNVLNADER